MAFQLSFANDLTFPFLPLTFSVYRLPPRYCLISAIQRSQSLKDMATADGFNNSNSGESGNRRRMRRSEGQKPSIAAKDLQPITSRTRILEQYLNTMASRSSDTDSRGLSPGGPDRTVRTAPQNATQVTNSSRLSHLDYSGFGTHGPAGFGPPLRRGQ